MAENNKEIKHTFLPEDYPNDYTAMVQLGITITDATAGEDPL